MKHLSHSLLPLVLLAVAGPAIGQGTVFFETGELYLLPVQGVTSPAFTSSVAGNLQGYRLNDAVVLASGTPVLVTAPGLHRSALPLPLPAVLPTGYVANDVRDLAILRGGGEEGRDALVMVTGAGMWTWHMGKETVTPPGGTPVVQWVVRMNALGTSAWAGAKRLRVADVNNDGIDDVLGIMSAERAIRCLQRDAAGTTWVIPANGHVRDFVVADVVAGGAPEIVAAIGPITSQSFDGGLRVFAPGNATALMQVNLEHESGVCASLQSASGVVLASKQVGVGGSPYKLRSFRMNNGVLAQQGIVDLPSEVTAITTGKWQTSAEEVLLTYRTTSNPAAVALTAELTFGAVKSMMFGSVAMTNNQARCLLADWHGDPMEPEAGLHCAPRLLYPSTGVGKIILQQTTSWDDRFVAVVGDSLSFAIAAPPDQRPTHVEIESWAMTLGPTGVFMPTRVSRREFAPIQQNGSDWYITPTNVDGSASGWLLATRFVSKDAAGVVVRRWPARSASVIFDVAWIPVLMAGFTGIQYVYPVAAVPVLLLSHGITGEVVQPPAGPDTDDEEPPAPDGGG